LYEKLNSDTTCCVLLENGVSGEVFAECLEYVFLNPKYLEQFSDRKNKFH